VRIQTRQWLAKTRETMNLAHLTDALEHKPLEVRHNLIHCMGSRSPSKINPKQFHQRAQTLIAIKVNFNFTAPCILVDVSAN
jgi:hypothetical protein